MHIPGLSQLQIKKYRGNLQRMLMKLLEYARGNATCNKVRRSMHIYILCTYIYIYIIIIIRELDSNIPMTE